MPSGPSPSRRKIGCLESAASPHRGVRRRQSMAQSWRELVALWGRGAWQSVQLQRALALCLQDARIAKKCGQGALLNGAVLCGSLLFARHVLSPLVEAILSWGMGPVGGEAAVRASGTLILLIYDALWILPVYCVSLLIGVVWCKDVADMALGAIDGRTRRRPDTDALAALSEKAYTVLVLSLFYAQASLIGTLPRIGTPAACLLLSWLWAYYCFDYVWAFRGVALRSRLIYFESNWAFFSGFGALCALITESCTPYVAAAISGVVFPLFVLVACGTDLRGVPGLVGDGGGGHDRIPIFGIAEAGAHLVVDCIAGKVPAALQAAGAVGRVVKFLRM
eukprot:evm.model.scf_1562.4 EVM.evm.TU.scf_1562.4   scf_1562:28843-29850(-)